MNDDAEQPRGLAARLGRWSARHRALALGAWLVFVVAAVVGGQALGTTSIPAAETFDGESKVAERALADAGFAVPADEAVLLADDRLTTGDRAFQTAIADTQRRLEATKDVRDVSAPDAARGTVSADGHSALIGFTVAGDPDTAVDRIAPALAAIARSDAVHPDLAIAGAGSASGEQAVEATIEDDFKQAELSSVPITLLVLLLAFGSLVAAGIPVLLALSAVAAAMGLVAVPSQLVGVDEAVGSIILLIGLAVGVDYSLFYLRREREERARGASPQAALETAAATSGRAVLISGLTVIVAMAGMFLTGNASFQSIGLGTMIVVLVAMVGSVTALPALLALLGDRIERGRIPFLGRRRGREPRVWGWLVERVMRRPVVATVVAGGALLALALPALGLQTTVTGVNDLPRDLEVIRTYDRIQQAFPAEGSAALAVVQAADVRSPASRRAIAALRREAVASGAALEPTSVAVAPDGTVARVDLPLAGGEDDESAQRALSLLRDRVVPATIGAAGEMRADITGEAAATADFNELMSTRTPLVFAFVLGLAFVLLLATFRSIVVPLKAIALNLLSVGAAYGVLVLVFQEGWGSDLLGFEPTGAVVSWLPMFLFVILFGLSMDYHVFILSRVRESVDRGMPTDQAVQHGITTTAGVVTSAAAVMVGVFSVFGTLSFIDVKQMGVGLSVAVLLDATVIRGILLPATMKLLGEWNWYLPQWLEWLPRVSGEAAESPGGGSSAEASAEAQPTGVPAAEPQLSHAQA